MKDELDVLAKCHGCGEQYKPTPSTIAPGFCESCENKAAKIQLGQAQTHLRELRDKLGAIHQHPEWSPEKVRMEIFSILLYYF